MSYFTLKIVENDIAFDVNMRLETIEDIAQSYKVLLETQFESDSRDPNYGCKIQELIQTDYDNIPELIELFVKEALMQHPMTSRITSLDIIKYETKKYRCNVRLTLKSEEELKIEGVVINV